MNDILIAEISGKRPGDRKARPTERFETQYDKVIISNNSEGYISDWPIVNVPDDYREWYIENIKSSENAWYAPMNRSYAIKYAREHGYKYLVQADDNITKLELATLSAKEGTQKRLRKTSNHEMLDDFIKMFVCVLENTNAAMVGCTLSGIGEPEDGFLKERYVYSLFALNLDVCPDIFQGDFEDDIEYRLKCAQKGLPVVQVVPLRYGKVGQALNKDLTGCRAEYAKAGLKRGEHMQRLYADIYSCRMRNRSNAIMGKAADENVYFKHIIKPFKVGVIVKDMKPMKDCINSIFQKYTEHKQDKIVIKEKKVKRKGIKNASN